MPTFNELKLPESSFEKGSLVLYKAWLKSLMTQTTETSRIDAYDLNTDKDIFGLTETAAIAAAFNAYGLEKIFGSFTENLFNNPENPEDGDKANIVSQFTNGDEVGKPSKVTYNNTSTGDDFLNQNVLTIAAITIHPDAMDESVIVLPEGTEDATPEMLDPFYDPSAGTLYATIGGRIGNISVSHNRILNLKLDKEPNGLIKITEIDIEEIPLN